MVFSGIRAAVVLSLMLGVAGVSAQQGDRSAGTSPSPRSASPAQQPAGQQPATTAQQPTTSTPQPATSAPAPAATPQAPPTFRGGISYARVDAIVTDKRGQPVFDLKQADFEVLEDGKPQTVDSFKLIRVDGNPKPGDPPPRPLRTRDDEETEAARDDVRVFVIFLDDYHVRAANALRMREVLTKFINLQLRPLDIVAVMYPLTPVSIMGFTRNLDGVMNAVQHFEGRKYN